ncbi:hypothetical protein [Allorhizobium undicola]|uniref:hypothetical protein n=1 Tax=Allorhizobium undicola TaxID=78527 RepID=UPI00047F06AE|nr:hypothetical protein [Allorhizobium undicola]
MSLDKRIIPAVEMGELLEASALLEKARVTLEDAREQAATLMKDARDTGYRDGLEQGLREGFSRTEAVVREAHADLRSMEGEVEAVVVRSIGLVLGAIEHDDLTRRLVARAVADVNEQRSLRLMVAAEDEKLVRSATETLQPGLEIVVDRFLVAGEMTLESPSMRRQIGLKEQISQLLEALSHGR